MIPSLEGALNHVVISPKEQYISFTTQRGIILNYTINLKAIQPVIYKTSCNSETNITQIIWRDNEHQLFFGDTKGQVFLINLVKFKNWIIEIKNVTLQNENFLKLEESSIKVEHTHFCDFLVIDKNKNMEAT